MQRRKTSCNTHAPCKEKLSNHVDMAAEAAAIAAEAAKVLLVFGQAKTISNLAIYVCIHKFYVFSKFFYLKCKHMLDWNWYPEQVKKILIAIIISLREERKSQLKVFCFLT